MRFSDSVTSNVLIYIGAQILMFEKNHAANENVILYVLSP